MTLGHQSAPPGERVAFVLGGGGVLGANEVGMLRALCEAGIQPDVILGTSVGAINGALVASGFHPGAVDTLAEVWSTVAAADVFAGSALERLATLARSRTHLHGNEPLRRLLEQHLSVRCFEDLVVPFECVAACIERSCARWFARGPIVPAVLASAAVPGLLPPVEIDGEHYYDGGLVHSIPVGRAVALGATTVYVLQVGRVDQPLSPPTSPWQVGLVAFEIARRHRFVEEMRLLPEGVTVHVLPTGEPARRAAWSGQLRYRNVTAVSGRISRAYAASQAYLSRQHT